MMINQITFFLIKINHPQVFDQMNFDQNKFDQNLFDQIYFNKAFFMENLQKKNYEYYLDRKKAASKSRIPCFKHEHVFFLLDPKMYLEKRSFKSFFCRE